MKARKWYVLAGSLALFLAILSCGISYNMGSQATALVAPGTMVVENSYCIGGSGFHIPGGHHRNRYIYTCFTSNEYKHSWCNCNREKSACY